MVRLFLLTLLFGVCSSGVAIRSGRGAANIVGG
jgi:hypothetical protein